MSERPLPWLIAYDVRCPRRLQRLRRFLSRVAAPVQYSVFLLYARSSEMHALMDVMAAGWISPEDDLRAYPVLESGVTAFGRPRCPEQWSGWLALIQQQGNSDQGQPL
ncbi:hypothetical protein [Rehaibacterium terrae]|jgi:CRISPR-associated protein Cas2|uniref:CRISPR-associated endoribonuclease Cas2 n=1 Tax=Rehaibacterium terrae TaxID=1341696 RepID=A0A7W7Y0L0_9GAMM|nr:hypothetical protein [Rehaibacterium terrae]MBB5015878.1 CRISPR-associated protein Cas2 [Rehaibacterium terrae]